jgi:hypothetical protein
MPWFILFIVITTIEALARKKHRFSIHMTNFSKIEFHDVNFIDVAPSPTCLGCGSSSNIENLQPMNENPKQLVNVLK